jgi:two-component system, response regulator YesN
MYNVVIVDDEHLVLYGVCALFKNRENQFCVQNTFRDGRQALKFCQQNPPDLLLTDLRMPGMDGLSLIESLKPGFPDMKIVVLSCHEDYDLVHRAYKLGADEYLLKHNLEENYFFQTLDDLLPAKTHMPLPTTEKLYPEIISERSGYLGIIGFKQKYDAGLEVIPWSPDQTIIRQILQNNLDHSAGEHCFSGPLNEILLYFPSESREEEHRKKEIRRKAERLRLLLSNYVNRPVFLSLEHFDRASAPSVYRQALNTLELKFYSNQSCILTGNNEKRKKREKPRLSLTGEDCLFCWEQAIAACLDHGKSRMIPPRVVKSDLSFALSHLFYELEELSENREALLQVLQSGELYDALSRIDDHETLRIWVEQKLKECFNLMKTLREGQTVVESVREYIKKNYARPLTLSESSTLFHVTPSYLSTRFKQETGIGFIEYLNRIRVRQACTLLATTDLTVKEISYRTGYENPNYLSRVFKKQMNITLSEYRKNIIDRS